MRRIVWVAAAAVPLALTGLLPLSPAGGYVRPGVTSQVDLAPGGAQPLRPAPDLSGNRWNYSSIDASGRYVAFDSWSANLVPGDTNLVGDVFVRDTKTGRTTRVSVASDGSQALPGVSLDDLKAGSGYETASRQPFISANGMVVAFDSDAPNLAPADTNAAVDVFVHDLETRKTERVSVASDGSQANAGSVWASVSADGRFVTFASAASNLVPGDTNGAPDVFVRDRKLKKTTLVSVEPNGSQFPDAPSGSAGNLAPSISPDGKLVAFTENSLQPGKPSFLTDVFVRNLATKKTVQVNVGDDGTPQPAPGAASTPWESRGSLFSGNDRYVAFIAAGDIGLIPNGTTSSTIVVHDLVTGRNSSASVSPAGELADDGAGPAVSISADGRFVAFSSVATNLDANYDNDWAANGYSCLSLPMAGGGCGPERTFVHDMLTGATAMVSRTTDGRDTVPPFPQCQFGTLGAKPYLWFPSISAGGRWVTFEGCGLSPGEGSNTAAAPAGHNRENQHVYTRAIGLPLGAGDLAASRGLTLAGSRSFATTGFARAADAAGDVDRAATPAGADLAEAVVAYRPEYDDLFVRLSVHDMRPVALADPALVYVLDLTVGTTRYQLRIGVAGVAPSYGVFREDGTSWVHVADVAGGYGTTGSEVVATLPLAAIGAQRGGRLSDVTAVSGFGSYASGVLVPLDSLRLD